MDAIDPNDVEDLVDLIDAVPGIKSVSAKASKVRAPGIWVQVQGWTHDTLGGGYVLDGRLLLVVPDKDADKARDSLVELYNLVLQSGIRPAGRVQALTVVLPHSPAPLPGLAVPYAVNCEPAQE